MLKDCLHFSKAWLRLKTLSLNQALPHIKPVLVDMRQCISPILRATRACKPTLVSNDRVNTCYARKKHMVKKLLPLHRGFKASEKTSCSSLSNQRMPPIEPPHKTLSALPVSNMQTCFKLLAYFCVSRPRIILLWMVEATSKAIVNFSYNPLIGPRHAARWPQARTHAALLSPIVLITNESASIPLNPTGRIAARHTLILRNGFTKKKQASYISLTKTNHATYKDRFCTPAAL